jgi:hypothetical protein
VAQQTAERELLAFLVEVMVTGFDGDELDGNQDPQEYRDEFRETITTLTEHSPRQSELVECAMRIFDELFPPEAREGLVQSMLQAPETYRS